MSIFFCLGSDLIGQLATTTGWGNFRNWADKLPLAQYHEIVVLADHGWSQELPRLRSQLAKAIKTNTPDSPDVAVIAGDLIDWLADPQIESCFISTGMGADDDSDGTADGMVHDDDLAAKTITKISDTKEACHGEHGHFAACGDSSAAGTLDHAAITLGNQVDGEIAKSPALSSTFQKVKDAIGAVAKNLYLNELPTWAMEHADVWVYEKTMNAAQPGGVLAVKVAAYAAVKAWQGVKKLLGKATPDFDTVVNHLHDAMSKIGNVTGFDVPTVEDVRQQLIGKGVTT